MKYILSFLLIFSAFDSGAQSFGLPDFNSWDTSLLFTELKNDTLFIYLESRRPHTGCLINGCNQQYEVSKWREVYVAVKSKIVLIRKDSPKYREKEVTEKKVIAEEYW